MQIGPIRNHLDRNGASDQDTFWVSAKPVPLELPYVAFFVEDMPCLFAGDRFQALQQIIRDVRSAIRQAIRLPQAGQFRYILRWIKEFHEYPQFARIGFRDQGTSGKVKALCCLILVSVGWKPCSLRSLREKHNRSAPNAQTQLSD